MDFDLRAHLLAWPYDGANPANNFRRVVGEDGRPLIQVREPLGIQQMEYEGRPDGFRPHGKTTWLEYYESVADGIEDFRLSQEDCRLLMQEGVLFYQRYLVLYQMNDWHGVARDTQRNLAYFDFVRNHAQDREDYLVIEQYRPYVLRMNGISRGYMLWNTGKFEAALALLRERLNEIRKLEPIESEVFSAELERSVKHLEQVIEEFEKKRPETHLEKLKREQKEAILHEDFERAARLRDQIRAIQGEFVPKN